MATYRKSNWPVLLEEFENSGLTQMQFCKNKDINPRYFSLRRSKHLAGEHPAFSKVELEITSRNQVTGITI